MKQWTKEVHTALDQVTGNSVVRADAPRPRRVVTEPAKVPSSSFLDPLRYADVRPSKGSPYGEAMPPRSSSSGSVHRGRDASPPRVSRRRKSLCAHAASLAATFASYLCHPMMETLWLSLSLKIQPSALNVFSSPHWLFPNYCSIDQSPTSRIYTQLFTNMATLARPNSQTEEGVCRCLRGTSLRAVHQPGLLPGKQRNAYNGLGCEPQQRSQLLAGRPFTAPPRCRALTITLCYVNVDGPCACNFHQWSR